MSTPSNIRKLPITDVVLYIYLEITHVDVDVLQVPMDVSHGKSFLDCAISGSPISQMTIMHAYQTCIKRVVRFANSLQVTKEMETVH